MVDRIACLVTFAVCLIGISCADGPTLDEPKISGNAAIPADGQDLAEVPTKSIEGLWSGSWGGGEAGGVVMQPVVAEMVILGDRIELLGFPKHNRLAGVVRVDANAGELRIVPVNSDGQQLDGETTVCSYRLEDGTLTLVVGETEVTLQSEGVAREPLANPVVELLALSRVTEAGDLSVNDYSSRRTVGSGAPFFSPRERILSTKDATALLVEESGVREISLNEARSLAGGRQRVAIVYRQPEREVGIPLHTLWREASMLEPDGAAAQRAYADMLRPGTLVFVLPHSESVPKP